MTDEIPVFFSEDNFNSSIPAHIRSFVYESARIGDVVQPDGKDGLVIRPKRPDKPKRSIAVYFEQDNFSRCPELFFLTEIAEVEHAEAGVRIKPNRNMDLPICEATYDNWLRNATNRAVLNRLSDSAFEIALADSLNAIYLTDSAFEAQLLALSSRQEQPPSCRTTGVNFLRANAGFLNIQSAAQIANLRSDSPAVFEKFQATMLHVASQLVGINDGFDDKAKQLYMKEIDPQVQAVNAQLSKTKTQAMVSGLLAASPFSLALLNLVDIPFGVTVAATIGVSAAVVQGIAGTLPALTERLQVKRTPAYIWSQIAKK
jgi:hypothetical protein